MQRHRTLSAANERRKMSNEIGIAIESEGRTKRSVREHKRDGKSGKSAINPAREEWKKGQLFVIITGNVLSSSWEKKTNDCNNFSIVRINK